MANTTFLTLFACCILLLAGPFLQAQEIDLLIKNGHVFDPKNDLDTLMDVAVTDGKILKVAEDIPAEKAKKVIDATGLYVCPGLIDIHTHVFVGSKANVFADGIYSLSPDDFSFRAGITTVVDAGTSGWRNFPQFKEQVIDKAKTRILAFLNIAGSGMTGNPDQQNVEDMDAKKTAKVIREYPETIVGVKIGHYEGESWLPFDRALEAGNQTDRPLFVECHLPQYSLEDQLNKMRPGDIITHSFENISERAPVVNKEGKVQPLVKAAQERGVLFDLGHGGAGFWFNQAIPALKQDFWPDTFGSDLHRFSMNAGMKDMLNIMSKYLSMGMPLKGVLTRATWNPAKAIQREDLGNLSPGAVADIAILSLQQGQFGFVDASGIRISGDQKLAAELTIRAGKMVWDLNGLSASPYEE